MSKSSFSMPKIDFLKDVFWKHHFYVIFQKRSILNMWKLDRKCCRCGPQARTFWIKRLVSKSSLSHSLSSPGESKLFCRRFWYSSTLSCLIIMLRLLTFQKKKIWLHLLKVAFFRKCDSFFKSPNLQTKLFKITSLNLKFLPIAVNNSL